ncbi:MAG TPA: hypothetical protein VM221_10605 [Armatimonadota bacterium]|nr:hypothetical protein [Armatimonadota bacterium]
MTSEQTKGARLPLRFRVQHPRCYLLLGVEGIALVALYTFVYLAFLRITGMGRLPGMNPLVGIAIGLGGGLCAVAVEGRRLGTHFEAEARALAFRDRLSRRAKLRRLSIPGIFLVTWGILYLAARYQDPPASYLLTGMGALFVPLVFLYRPAVSIYDRARQLLLEASDSPGTGEATRAHRPGRLVAWSYPLGVVSVIGVLALGAWLEWGVPFLAEREPKEYVTAVQPGGKAIRLTYGASASAPAISPDGKLVAYVRSTALFSSRIEIMRPDGAGKRQVRGGTSPALSMFYPPTWSPDGSRLLLIAQVLPPIKSWAELPKWLDSPAYDLWTVDVATGATRRLTTDGDYRGAAWVSSGRRIAALRKGSGKAARLWLMDENGGSRREVAKLKLRPASSAIQPWRGGRELVAVGRRESAGIWSVDAITGEATLLSDLKAYWALPLDAERLVIGVRGQAHPPLERAISVGVLDARTGEVRWVLRDIQGSISSPVLVRDAPVVLFPLWVLDSQDLWALHLKRGKLRRVTRDAGICTVAVASNASAIFYTGDAGEPQASGLLSLDQAIWRLTPSRPLASW